MLVAIRLSSHWTHCVCVVFSSEKGTAILKSVTPLEIGRYIIYLERFLCIVFILPRTVENCSCIKQLKASVPFELAAKSSYLSFKGLVFRAEYSHFDSRQD